MSTWNGAFIVVNGTNQTITNVSVTHRISNKTNTAQAQSLASGASTAPVTLNGESGHDDNWSVALTLHDGTAKSRIGKQCNFEPEDADKVTVVILYEKNFSIVYPESDSCMENSY